MYSILLFVQDGYDAMHASGVCYRNNDTEIYIYLVCVFVYDAFLTGINPSDIEVKFY